MDLTRFLTAQEHTYEMAKQEISNGRKASHWMWFIFPQLIGLGFSASSQYYAIHSLDEAKQYFQHPILGKRLLEITQIVLNCANPNICESFSEIDAMKLKSCMTLFWYTSKNPIFVEVINKYFEGQFCEYSECFCSNNI